MAHYHNSWYRFIRNKPWKPDKEKSAFLEKHPHRHIDIDNWWNFSYNRNPGWWTNLVENRPKRRRDKLLARKIVKGDLDPDEALFELDYRPHIYWW